MNERKICFIMCYNDESFALESSLYIESLKLPRNMELEILTIKDAPSMAFGYQSAMNDSDAKYKIYLHQDVFILNENFIIDILNIFQEKDIGMIGMVGAVKLPKDGIMWHAEEECGMMRFNQIVSEKIMHYPVPIETKYREVEAVDGMLMATSVDIPWRCDLFKGFHFYDISQSLEFRKAGYRVVVPKQNLPWCLHDDDLPVLDSDYEYWHRIFLDNYSALL